MDSTQLTREQFNVRADKALEPDDPLLLIVRNAADVYGWAVGALPLSSGGS